MSEETSGATRATAEELVREYAPRVYNLAHRFLNNEADVEDVTQDVLLQVLRKYDSFRGESAFPTWLHRITVNAALSYRRKRNLRDKSRAPESVLDEETPAGPVRRWSVSPDQGMLDQETQELIEASIARLPETYRDVYVLADVEGQPVTEVASMLGLNLPAVKSRLHRARLMMRKALASHFEEPTS